VFGSQYCPAAQSADVMHAAQAWRTGSQRELGPTQSASVRHATQIAGGVRQNGAAVLPAQLGLSSPHDPQLPEWQLVPAGQGEGVTSSTQVITQRAARHVWPTGQFVAATQATQR